MDLRTLMALQKSIKKWERYAKAKDFDEISLGTGTCPLCRLFHSNSHFVHNNQTDFQCCVGCPIFENDNSHYQCHGTPYEAAEWAESYDMIAFRKSAKQEAEFLQSLLPKD